MKQLFSLIALCLILLPFTARAELVDRIVAVVNDDTITLSEVEEEGKKLFQEIARETSIRDLVPILDRARREVLSSLIDKLLIEQRAKELNITAGDEEIQSSMDRVLEGTGLSETDFSNQLLRQGMTVEKYRQDMKWQILKGKLLNYEIRSKVVVTDEKARNYYNKEYSRSDIDGYHILQIGLSAADRSGKSAAQLAAEINILRQQALAGVSFPELARSSSELPSAHEGGDLGFFQKDELSGLMKATILAMKPGDISPAIETPEGGMQFFKLLSVKDGDVIVQAPYESVKDDIMQHLQELETQEQFANWVTTLRGQAFIQQIL